MFHLCPTLRQHGVDPASTLPRDYQPCGDAEPLIPGTCQNECGIAYAAARTGTVSKASMGPRQKGQVGPRFCAPTHLHQIHRQIFAGAHRLRAHLGSTRVADIEKHAWATAVQIDHF
jgi:hypothetical protein